MPVKQPKVGVVVSNFNYSNFISDCITSILEQGYKNLDVVIVDDKSTDGSLEKIEAFKQKYKIKVHVNEINSGQIASLKAGFDRLDDDVHFVQFVDADDIIHENCCGDLLNAFLNVGPEHTIAAGYCNLIDKFGHVFSGYSNDKPLTGNFEIIPPNRYKFPQWPVNSPTSGIMFRRAAARLVFDHEVSTRTRLNADFLLVGVLYFIYGCINLHKTVFSYRIHGNNNFMKIGKFGDLTFDSSTDARAHQVTFKIARSLLMSGVIPAKGFPAFSANFLTQNEFMRSRYRFKDLARLTEKSARRPPVGKTVYTTLKFLRMGSTARNALGVNIKPFLNSKA